MVDGCRVTDDEVKKDAQRLGNFLKQGDDQFLTDFGDQYGHNKAKTCALQQLMKELSQIDPQDVRVLSKPAEPAYGYMNGDFPVNSADKALKSYSVNVWQFVCHGLIEELGNKKLNAGEASAILRTNLDPADGDRFITEWKAKAKGLPYEAFKNDQGNVVIRYNQQSASK